MKKDFLLPAFASLVLCGCTSVYTVKIPLASNEPVFADAPQVVIEDERPSEDLETHIGKLFGPCARHYGDDTYLPPKLVYLEKLIADRVPANQPVRIRLEKFDTIEYCENTKPRQRGRCVRGDQRERLPGLHAGQYASGRRQHARANHRRNQR